MSQRKIKNGQSIGQRIRLLELQNIELAQNIIIMNKNFHTLLELYAARIANG